VIIGAPPAASYQRSQPNRVEMSIGDTTTTSIAPSSTVSTSSTTGSTPPPAPSSSTIAVTSTSEPAQDDLVGRLPLDVGTVNASDLSGVARETAERLRSVGYERVQPVDASNPVGADGVYFQPGLEREATRLADDLGWSGVVIAPYDQAPALETERVFQLVAVIGLDDR
jgi:hypothetical protein